MFLAELHSLQLWGADVGNVYLQELTRDKIYIVAGPEFEELQGHVLVMTKHSIVQDLGEHVGMTDFFIFSTKWVSMFQSSPDIWMKLSKDGTHYEYIAVYVDDLSLCMQDPQAFCDTLKEKYKLKLKDVGPIS